MNRCKAQSKERERERVRAKRSSANNKICFEVRAPSSTSPPSHMRILSPLACPQRTPTKGNLHRGFGAITITRSTQLLSLQTQPPQHNEGKAQSQANEGFTTWWSKLQPQTIYFPHKDPIE